MTNVLQAQVVLNIMNAQPNDVGLFIVKYAEKGNYVEVSRAYLKSLSESGFSSITLGRSGTLNFFKSLTLPIRYGDELQQAIEKDKYERQTYSKTGELTTAQYTRQSGNVMDCVLVNKTSEEVTVIYMIGENMSITDFMAYLQVLRNIGKPAQLSAF